MLCLAKNGNALRNGRTLTCGTKKRRRIFVIRNTRDAENKNFEHLPAEDKEAADKTVSKKTLKTKSF